jgi:hypothetical protein
MLLDWMAAQLESQLHPEAFVCLETSSGGTHKTCPPLPIVWSKSLSMSCRYFLLLTQKLHTYVPGANNQDLFTTLQASKGTDLLVSCRKQFWFYSMPVHSQLGQETETHRRISCSFQGQCAKQLFLATCC